VKVYIESINEHHRETTTMSDNEKTFIPGGITVGFKVVSKSTVFHGETDFPYMSIENLDIPKIKDTIYDSLGWGNPEKEESK
jgi:hypothetical protein